MADYKGIMQQLLSQAGVEINGSAPWDIQVHNSGFYERVITQGTLGLGESFMDGWWDCEAVDQLFDKMLRAELHEKVRLPLVQKASILMGRLSNRQTRQRSKRVVDEHYDSGSEIIFSFLDPYKQYSCGYFKGTDDLGKAQEKKLDLICQKLMLSGKDRVLDIGCGYGGFARFAAERYGCEVTGISPSGEQVEYAREFCKDLPVRIVQSDYRDFRGSFTKVVSVGMIEHVGHKNYRRLMEMAAACLERNGLFLLQTIGGNTSMVTGDPWFMRHIFPNSMLPSARQITEAVEELFMLEDLHNFGAYYDLTLMAWHKNFKGNWSRFEERYDDRVFRMWTYYLRHFAGTFRARMNQVWQFVFSRKGIPGGYPSIR
jgi:cyclopropane-fatty-acyl-phospholipid synthase